MSMTMVMVVEVLAVIVVMVVKVVAIILVMMAMIMVVVMTVIEMAKDGNESGENIHENGDSDDGLCDGDGEDSDTVMVTVTMK